MPDDLSQAAYMYMSPGLLSKQPPMPSEKPQKDQKDWAVTFNYLESRYSSLRNWRWSWWQYWTILARFFIPRRMVPFVTANRQWRGHPVNDAIIDSTGQLGVRTARGGMWSGLTSPSRPWAKLGPALPWAKIDAAGVKWYERTEQKLFTVLAQSNFYAQMAQVFEDEITFGTSPLLTMEDAEDGVRFYVPCAGEYYLANGGRLSVNTFLREFTLTVGQIVDMFTIANCPEQVAKLWNESGSSMDREFVVCHMIEPNFDLNNRSGGKITVVPHTFAWREVYWLKGIKTAKPLSLRGFNKQPFAVFRWATTSNDAYGRGPCMDALGDTKQVQTETYRKAEFIEKGVRPPMGADVAIKNEPASTMPSGITFMDSSTGKKGFWPLFEINPAWLQWLTQDIDKVNARINTCLFVDLFMAISRMEGVQPRNELELNQRNLERLQELGPVIELNEAALSDTLLRVLDIMQRRNMLDPMPDSVRGVPLKITYVSILRLAQIAAQSIAMKDGFQQGGLLSSAAQAAGLPNPLRIINLDDAYRKYLEMNQFPMSTLFTKDEVTLHDEAREKAMQAQQAPAQAQAAVEAAKTLADTQMGGNTALSSLVGGGQGGP